MAVPNKSEWTSAFNVIFEELSERNLPDTSFSSFESKNALQMTTKGEALFQCPKCPRYWGSSNGSIKFDYRLSINRGTKAGYGDVKLFAFGQKCQKCANCPFVPARFNGDSIDRALNILLLKVREKFYGDDVTDELERFFNETSGKDHKGPHDPKLCQACHLGVCKRSISSNQSHSHRRGAVSGSGPVPRSRQLRFILSFADDSDDENRASRGATKSAKPAQRPSELAQRSACPTGNRAPKHTANEDDQLGCVIL